MKIFEGLQVSAGGMAIEKKRMEVAAMNLSNIDNTNAGGGPYQPLRLVMNSQESFNIGGDDSPSFSIVRMNSLPRMVFEPSHPDADPNGYVAYPDINVIDEMIETMSASRAYEANITAFNEAKSIYNKALEIGRV